MDDIELMIYKIRPQSHSSSQSHKNMIWGIGAEEVDRVINKVDNLLNNFARNKIRSKVYSQVRSDIYQKLDRQVRDFVIDQVRASTEL